MSADTSELIINGGRLNFFTCICRLEGQVEVHKRLNLETGAAPIPLVPLPYGVRHTYSTKKRGLIEVQSSTSMKLDARPLQIHSYNDYHYGKSYHLTAAVNMVTIIPAAPIDRRCPQSRDSYGFNSNLHLFHPDFYFSHLAPFFPTTREVLKLWYVRNVRSPCRKLSLRLQLLSGRTNRIWALKRPTRAEPTPRQA